ncbi:HAD family hydrolase [Streptomyces sp. NPDC051214]|uniref:HAD family hydrolase n=1 Tax=Streptomyces sp. NPDC051214 TaxID=3155282 RepID=UPI00343185EC
MARTTEAGEVRIDKDPHAFHVLGYTTEDDDFQILLEGSSLGTDGARRLRGRTPLEDAREAAAQNGPTPEGPWQVPGLRTVVVDVHDDGFARDLIRRARHVIFDFDGPLCMLFASTPSGQVTRRLVDWLSEIGLSPSQDLATGSPYSLLRAVAVQYPGSDLVTGLEERLTNEELIAVASAWPTEFADPLIRTWNAMGARLAISTGVSAVAAQRYLDGRDLTGTFSPHLTGRTADDLDLDLNPELARLESAMSLMDAHPDHTLVISSSPAAAAAAQQAGVAFFGYGRSPQLEKELLVAGAPCTTPSLELVLRTLRDFA